MKILSVGAELFHADERTDGRRDKQDKANSRISQFSERRSERPTLPASCVRRCRSGPQNVAICLQTNLSVIHKIPIAPSRLSNFSDL